MMKKGGTTAIVLVVLVIGIIGAVLLYSGTSGTTGATPVTGKDTSGSSEFSLEENDGDCRCHIKCTLPGPGPEPRVGYGTHFVNDLAECACIASNKNSCDAPCATSLSQVSAANPTEVCTLLTKTCTKDPDCGKLQEVCHCPDGQKCHTIKVKPFAVSAHVGAEGHPPRKDTLGPCPPDTSTTTTSSSTTTTTTPDGSTTTVTVPPSSTSTTSTPSTTVTTEPPSTTSTTSTPSTTVTTEPPVTSTTTPSTTSTT